MSAINHYLRSNNKGSGLLNPGLSFFVNHTTQDIKINSYAIDKFFVEVVYDAEHNIITDLRSFKYEHSLDRYAPKID